MSFWKRLLRAVLGFGFVWLAFGFLAMDWNVLGWSGFGRFFLVTFGLIAAALASISREGWERFFESL